MIKKLAAISSGKFIFHATRALKMGGGYAAPGLYALKIDPNLVSKLINHDSKNIIVTGTNGKTTTSKLISHFLENSGNNIIRNSSGSNLERGIASYLVSKSSISGKLDYDFGVWELDEFAFNSVAPKIKPSIVILLNAFRDQLDRYGEVDTVVNRWQQTLGSLDSKTLVLVNNDDPTLQKALINFKGQVIKFGLKNSKILGEAKLQSKEKPDYEAEVLKTSKLGETDVSIKFNSSKFDFKLPLPGIFNAYNFLAAFSLMHLLNLNIDSIKDSLASFTSSFGRFEKFKTEGKEGSIFLIKNPVGATQVFQTIIPHISKDDSLLIALNDNFADGTDISWIWDIEMEQLKISGLKSQIFVTGVRSYDMALRLKYAGISESQIMINPNLLDCLDQAVKAVKGKLFILPTYTALIELQKIMVKKGVKKEYWKE